MKKGFTLMEILFVLLVIALVLSFALPAFRAIRYDVQNSKAKNALMKLAEARRSFYQYNKGMDIASTGGEGNSYFETNKVSSYTASTCLPTTATTGIPAIVQSSAAVSQLFACKFLDWHDFEGLPYTFYICNGSSAQSFEPCKVKGRLAGAIGNSNAGSKYNSTANYRMYISTTMQVTDTLD